MENLHLIKEKSMEYASPYRHRKTLSPQTLHTAQALMLTNDRWGHEKLKRFLGKGKYHPCKQTAYVWNEEKSLPAMCLTED